MTVIQTAPQGLAVPKSTYQHHSTHVPHCLLPILLAVNRSSGNWGAVVESSPDRRGQLRTSTSSSPVQANLTRSSSNTAKGAVVGPCSPAKDDKAQRPAAAAAATAAVAGKAEDAAAEEEVRRQSAAAGVCWVI